MIFGLLISFSLVFGIYGVVASIVVVFFMIKQRSLPQIDLIGLSVSVVAMFLYFLLPMQNSKSEAYSEVLNLQYWDFNFSGEYFVHILLVFQKFMFRRVCSD